MLDLFPSRDAGLFGRREKHARGRRVPVTVLTGFLGAGKTTLLRRLLQMPEGRGTAVIINEFGAVGIDDALVRASSEETVLLGNGCLCCVSRSDLQIALRRLVADRERGAIPPFRRIIIETSGLADPGPILGTFATDRALGDEFHLEAAVTVVDAATGRDILEWSAESRRQVILADRLILTKTELATQGARASLETRLRTLNPRAEVLVSCHGVIDPQALTANAAPASLVPPVSLSEEAVHSDGILSFVLRKDAPIQWAPFSRALDTLLAIRGLDILRAKGFVNVQGCRGPVLLQIVQHLAHPPTELRDWPDGDRTTRVVFITRHLPEAPVRALFSAVQALHPHGNSHKALA
jgi:G3E family GTPase